MSKELDDLEVVVKRVTTVNASAVALIKGIAAQILDAAGDKAKSIALANELTGDADSLATAVAENTPAPPVP